MAADAAQPDPTMEDAFIALVERHDPPERGRRMTRPRCRLAPAGALCRKESFQIVRDPSSILIAFVLPVVLLFIFGYGINLDAAQMRIGAADRGSRHRGRAVRRDARRARPTSTPCRRRRARAARRWLTAGDGARHRRSCSGLRRPPRTRGDARRCRWSPTAPSPIPPTSSPPTSQGAWASWLRPARARPRPAARRPIERRAALLVQPRRHQPQLPRARLDRGHHDDHRRAADLAGGRARMGARHDGGAAVDAGDAHRVAAVEDPALLRARHGLDAAVPRRSPSGMLGVPFRGSLRAADRRTRACSSAARWAWACCCRR